MKDTLPITIHACGRYAPQQVTVTFDPAPRPTSPELDASIAAEWDRQVALAATAKRVLFNGEMLRHISHHATESRFEMTVGLTCYRDFVGTNLYGQHWLDRVGWDSFSNPVGTTATLISADSLICYGLRSSRVAYHAEHVHTFGGALEMSDRRPDGSVDVFAALLRELHEELALDPTDLLDLTCVGLIRDKEIHQPELLFEARMRFTADELRERWKTAESRDEHQGIVTLEDKPDAIFPFIRSCKHIAPVAIGALLIHGRLAHGQTWLNRASLELAETL